MSGLAGSVVNGTGRFLAARLSRRGLLARGTVVASALAVSPLDFLLRPQSAYATMCGPDAGCGDGWTAMCCTIHHGVNQCPPGTFAGGWWKADSSSLCGGGPRYYVDCQAECRCDCGGSSFCAEGCWDCHPHCAHGTCDERRVCWNVFRYGQCNQDVGCSGPVTCRMISCVAPWRFENCTRDSATDNATAEHSAPCLPEWSPIQRLYARLGGAGSPLGVEVNREVRLPGGRFQVCEHGGIYHSGHGTHYLLGPVYSHYRERGGPRRLGFPTSGIETSSLDRGQFAHFAGHAVIYWSAATGAHEVSGPILTLWGSLGHEHSPLGYPTAEQVPIDTGRALVQHFQNGAIYSGAGHGTHDVYGRVYTYWLGHGGRSGVIGYPTADVTTDSSGTETGQFTGGTLTCLSTGVCTFTPAPGG